MERALEAQAEGFEDVNTGHSQGEFGLPEGGKKRDDALEKKCDYGGPSGGFAVKRTARGPLGGSLERKG